ncbi:MAG: PIN domain-containing protein [Cyanobacteria bacterium J06643_4]
MTEALHLIYKRGGGWTRQKILLQLLAGSLFDMFEVHPSDYQRLLDLMERYQDRPMDFADASIVLAAERTNKRKILTLDSDFLFYRIN